MNSQNVDTQFVLVWMAFSSSSTCESTCTRVELRKKRRVFGCEENFLRPPSSL